MRLLVKDFDAANAALVVFDEELDTLMAIALPAVKARLGVHENSLADRADYFTGKSLADLEDHALAQSSAQRHL